jgi:hypothetical protein
VKLVEVGDEHPLTHSPTALIYTPLQLAQHRTMTSGNVVHVLPKEAASPSCDGSTNDVVGASAGFYLSTRPTTPAEFELHSVVHAPSNARMGPAMLQEC